MNTIISHGLILWREKNEEEIAMVGCVIPLLYEKSMLGKTHQICQ